MPVFNMCRICLSADTDEGKMEPLFEENLRCAEIVKRIEECGGIVLKPHDEFPKMICFQCLESLNTSHKFRTMCQASENALLDAIVKSELKTEPQDNGNSLAEDALRQESTHIFFDLQTEFIDAEEVQFEDLTAAHDVSTHSQSDDSDADITNENFPDFVEDSENEDSEDNDVCTMDRKLMKHRGVVHKKVKQKKSSSSVHRRRLPQTSAHSHNSSPTPAPQTTIKKTGRGRRKLEVLPDNIMCEICGNIYQKRSMLNAHMKRHMAEKNYHCEICGKSFTASSEIGRHIRVHTGEKPYKCRFCGRTFADRSTNIKHERIHTNERPFTCITCGKSFTYSNVLKNHMLTHTGEKPFPCLPCNKTFSRKHQLDQHLATLTHQQTVKNMEFKPQTLPPQNVIHVHDVLVKAAAEGLAQ